MQLALLYVKREQLKQMGLEEDVEDIERIRARIREQIV